MHFNITFTFTVNLNEVSSDRIHNSLFISKFSVRAKTHTREDGYLYAVSFPINLAVIGTRS
jgi:hypothetical protein